MKRTALALVLCGLLLLPGRSAAQGASQLRGTVKDETGAVLSGATVGLEDEHGSKTFAQTDNEGRYVLTVITPGTYTLTCTLDGFGLFSQRLDLSRPLTHQLDVTLKITMTAQVSVTAALPRSLFNQTLTGEQVAALPDDRRQLALRLQRMAMLMGGGEDSVITVNGEGGPLPAKDEIESIRINGNMFSAEFATPSPVSIDIVTKPAAQKFDGEFPVDFNDTVLNARNAFSQKKERQQVRSYNGYLSGPIVPKYLSFSVSLRRAERDDSAIVNATRLNAATLAPEAFVGTFGTPTRETSASIRTTVAMPRQTMVIRYTYWQNREHNQGVGGLDLPERAYGSLSREDDLSLTLRSSSQGRLLNEFHAAASRGRSTSRALTQGPGIVVLDAFNAGGNQDSLFRSDVDNDLRVSDTVTYMSGRHQLKAGLGVDGVGRRSQDEANFGGTFTFGSDVERDSFGNPVEDADGHPMSITPLERYRRVVAGLAGYSPSQFSIVQGTPSTRLTEWRLTFFANEDWSASQQFTFSYGVRYDAQTHLSDLRSIAPRLALAWKPSQERSDTLKIGGGLFYQGVGTDVIFRTQKLNGSNQQELIVESPAFFPVVPDVLRGTTAPVSVAIYKRAANLRSPYSILSAVSYAPELPWSLYGSIAYMWQRGAHVLRTRNINAPNPVSESIPMPESGPIFQVESDGRSVRHELRLSVSRDLGSRASFYANYTLASSRSDTDDPWTVPANSYDLSTEFGRASVDPRQKFSLGGSLTLPGHFDIEPYFSITSGLPFNVITGRDNNGDSSFTDRPAFGNAGDTQSVVTAFGTFNPNPGAGDRIIPRNFGQGPKRISTNLYVSRSFVLMSSAAGGYHYKLTLAATLENVINHANLTSLNGVLTSPLFGLANHAGTPRQATVSARFSF